MELLRRIPLKLNLKRKWRRRRYSRVYGSPVSRRKNMQIVRLGGGNAKRVWRIKSVAKFRLNKLLKSPLTLWKKFKNAYTSMMMNFAGSVATLSGGNSFALPQTSSGDGGARVEPLPYSQNEFENRLIYEIYKSFVSM